jgi:thiol-disulfide isomerase/thioredoxin
MLLFVLFASFSLFAYSQERDTNVVCLHFNDNKYEEAILKITCEGDSVFNFNGLLCENSWIFKYPHCLYKKSNGFTIEIPTHNDTIFRMLSFKQVIDNDTLRTPQFTIDDVDTMRIDIGQYIKTDTFPNEFVHDRINNRIILATFLDDVYFMENVTSKEYLSSVELASNQHFIMMDTAQVYYDNRISDFSHLVQKYPYSHALIALLANIKNQYRAKSDVQKIFDNFSENQKSSYFGQKIQHFLSDNYFKNSILPVWNSENSENIVQDTSKINLVIFTASWCVPCRAEIPLLKEIYTDLHEVVEMTYLSMDDSTTIKAWKELMIKENIQWRSVLAASNLEEIKAKYYNPVLPTILIVYIDGKYEKIDVRVKKDRDKLYFYSILSKSSFFKPVSSATSSGDIPLFNARRAIANILSRIPSAFPSAFPSTIPSARPSAFPLAYPSAFPSAYPSIIPV